MKRARGATWEDEFSDQSRFSRTSRESRKKNAARFTLDAKLSLANYTQSDSSREPASSATRLAKALRILRLS